jgi:hypothetical protein
LASIESDLGVANIREYSKFPKKISSKFINNKNPPFKQEASNEKK